MKKNNMALIQKKIMSRNYGYATYLYKKLPTNLMYENFDKIVTGLYFKHICINRNSNNITNAINSQKFFSFHGYNQEVLWNALIIKRFSNAIIQDIKTFKEIENKIFLNDISNLKSLYERLSEVAKKSHKGIEVLVHLEYLNVLDGREKFFDVYGDLCRNYYISKVKYFVENKKIEEKIYDDYGDTGLAEYLKYKITGDVNNTDKLILFIDIDRNFNDIDYYESFVNYLVERSMVRDYHSCVANSIEEIFNITGDERLLPIISLNKKNLNIEYLEIKKNSYFEYELIGDYRKVLEITNNNIAIEKYDYCSYLFYIKSNIILKNDLEFGSSDSIQKSIYNYLKIIFNLSGDKVYHSAYTCLRLLDQYNVFNWAKFYSKYLIAYLDAFTNQNLEYFNIAFGYSGNVSPIRLVLAKDKNISKYFPNSEMFGNLVYNNFDIKDIDHEENCSWLSLLKYYRSKESICNLLRSPEEILNFHYSYIYIKKLIDSNNKDLAINILVSNLVTKPQFYNLYPLDLVFDLIVDNDFIDGISRSIIIFYKVNSQNLDENYERDLISKIRILLENILDKYEENLIQNFLDDYKDLNFDILIFFLYHIWDEYFMKNTLIYESVNQIREERIQVLKKLVDLDPDNKNKYINELQEKIKNQEINKISNLLHSSKVFVDVNSVKKACMDRLDKSFESFKNLIASNKNEEKLILLIHDNDGSGNSNTNDDGIDQLSHFDKSTVINFSGQKYKAHKIDQRSLLKFKDLITDVTNEFLMGASGLNSYLSTGIRHGILRSTLRNPLEKEQLMPSLLTGIMNNKIVENEINKNEIYEKIQKFSNEIDSIIDFITERIIQITVSYEFSVLYSMHDKYKYHSVNVNVFNYTFTFEEASQLIDKGKNDLSLFIDDLLNMLWLKTDEFLSKIKLILNTDIKQRFTDAFLTLHQDLLAINIIEQRELMNSIVSAESNFLRIFDETLHWFNKNNVYQLPELQFTRCIEISKNIIGKIIFDLNQWDGLKFMIDNDPIISGRYVSDLVYIFLDLFKNAYQHSKVDPKDLEIFLDISHLDGKFKIHFENNINLSLIDIVEVQNNLENIRVSIMQNESSELAQLDINSGLHKINNRISNDLLFQDKDIVFLLNESDSKFIIDIEFSIVGN